MGKPTFILKTSYKAVINKLSDKQAGVLFKMLFEYVENGANAGTPDERVDMAFEFIKLDLDILAEKYENKRKVNSDNGKKGGAPIGNNNRNKRTVEITTETTESSETSERLKIKPNENENENENACTTVHGESPPVGNVPYSEFLNQNAKDLSIKPPAKREVLEVFTKLGGTAEMAKAFWLKYDGLGWEVNGSKIRKIESFANKFISNWNEIAEHRKPKQQTVHVPTYKDV